MVSFWWIQDSRGSIVLSPAPGHGAAAPGTPDLRRPDRTRRLPERHISDAVSTPPGRLSHSLIHQFIHGVVFLKYLFT